MHSNHNLLKTGEVAKLLGVEQSTLYYWAKNNNTNKLLPVKFDKYKHRFYRMEDVVAYKEKVLRAKRSKNMKKLNVKLAKRKIKEAESKRRNIIATINLDVCKIKDYHNYYVGKFDERDNLLDVYKNRNQAVRHFFEEQGCTKKEAISKYLAFNGAMYLTMIRGGIWKGHYYKYISKDHELTINYQSFAIHTAANVPITVVDKTGTETQYFSIRNGCNNLNVPWEKMVYFLDKGKPYNDLYFYRNNKKVKFSSKREAINYFRIGKDKFKKLFESNQKIRGQILVIE